MGEIWVGWSIVLLSALVELNLWATKTFLKGTMRLGRKYAAQAIFLISDRSYWYRSVNKVVHGSKLRGYVLRAMDADDVANITNHMI